jgi:hypothetical protein
LPSPSGIAAPKVAGMRVASARSAAERFIVVIRLAKE